MTVGALNAAFGADTSVLSLLNLEMLRKLRVGWVMAGFAWYDAGFRSEIFALYCVPYVVSYIVSRSQPL